VTAHYDANKSRSVDCHPAQPGIPRYKLSDAQFVVALGNLQTFDSLPELKRCVVIVDAKFPSLYFVAHVALRNARTRLLSEAVMLSEAKHLGLISRWPVQK
jgi:hypothetical protein